MNEKTHNCIQYLATDIREKFDDYQFDTEQDVSTKNAPNSNFWKTTLFGIKNCEFSQMADNKKLVAEKITFHELCTTFNTIKNSVSSLKRHNFDKFRKRWTDEAMVHNPDGSIQYNTADSFFQALRLFVPSLDNERKFGIKESRLNQLVCKALMIKPLENSNAINCWWTNWLAMLEIDLLELSQISESSNKEERLNYLFRNCSALELRYIFHVIISDVEKVLGIMSSSTLINWFHAGTDNRLRSGETLREVCESVVGEETGEESPEVGRHLLCKPLQPMLLKRLNYNKETLPRIIRFCHRPFYLELKYDGEHLMLHKYCNDSYKYFTRNGIDYTHKLGADNNSLLSSKIHPFFKDNVQDCVLDCELLLWDKKLINIPLRDRIVILKQRVFKEEEKSTIFVSEKQEVKSAQEFADYYNKAMRDGEEGIVVKGMDTIYRMGSRAERNGWFKIKPDYGVQYEMNSNNVKSFMVAAREGENPYIRFRIVAGISAHLKKLDFMRLMGLLQQDASLLSSDTQPEWIAGTVKPFKNFKFIPRQNIQVVEVRASGVINGYLQFPAIASIRTDKLLEEIDSIDDLKEFDERLRSRPVTNEADGHEAVLLRNRKRRNELKLKESCKAVKLDPSSMSVVSDGLKDQKVCVLNGNDSATVQDLQKNLISFGAQIVANAGRTTSFVVAMNEKHVKTAAAIKANQWHVVNGNWLLRCQEAKKLLPWEPSDVIHLSPTAKFNLFSANTDKEAEVEEEEVEPEEAELEEETVSDGEAGTSAESTVDAEPTITIQDFSGEDSAAPGNGNLFQEFVFFIHSSVPQKIADDLIPKIEDQRGNIAKVLNSDVTHAVISGIIKFDDAENLFKWNEVDRSWLGIFVSADWIEKAIKDEDRYLASENLNNYLS
ncbi:ATP dependent DNA ligase domain-containing protein [Ditylenchus destructor]|nr:ATP dependent DNA ligase domain-containing protein [Ditylenchus destructor]